MAEAEPPERGWANRRASVSLVSLRALAISSNVAFIAYGLAAQLWPIVMLHVIMLPLNVIRLRDAFASLGPPSVPAVEPQ